MQWKWDRNHLLNIDEIACFAVAWEDGLVGEGGEDLNIY
jgi:hypothetical protein